MADKTEAEPCADRREGDRRVAEDPDYAGPERRAAQRRKAEDRRRSPRF